MVRDGGVAFSVWTWRKKSRFHLALTTLIRDSSKKENIMAGDKFVPYISLFLFSLFLPACASIVTGTHQEVTFNSNPDGAAVIVNGRLIGKTPVTAYLKKESGQNMIFKKEGYSPLTMQLETRMNPWFWGNIITGGLVGSSTDGLSGAVYEYSPNQYLATLQPEGTGSLETQTAISDRQKTKEYIVVNYNNIMQDLQKGNGEHLTSLFTLLHISDDQSGDAVKRTRALSEAYPDIPEFADHVIETFNK
jgi:hypothetical protein